MDESAQQKRSRQGGHDAFTRMYLVRHAPVVGAGRGALGLLYATNDEPADTSDTPSFRWLADWLPKNALLVTSGLKRTEATANAFLAEGYVAAERHVDPRFEEQFYGDWHGADRSSLADARQAAPHAHWFHSAAETPPGGESFIDVHARVAAALNDWAERATGRNVVIVGHGGVFRAALAHALGIDLDRALTISIENLSVTRIDRRVESSEPDIAGGPWRTVYVNRRPDR
ncbi:MAG: histidine phosphatase family protein [Pacificimonas sp.]